MDECIFCKIIAGDISAHKIYEDDATFAFLDAHPINPGHILVIPKSHTPDFHKLDDDTYQKVFQTVKRLSGVIEKVTHPKKIGLIVAGWDVPHTHVHVVPMHDYHDITSKAMLEDSRANPSDEELKASADALRDSL